MARDHSISWQPLAAIVGKKKTKKKKRCDRPARPARRHGRPTCFKGPSYRRSAAVIGRRRADRGWLPWVCDRSQFNVSLH